jgi:hypothetical protein
MVDSADLWQQRCPMSLVVSWWVLALIAGASAPFWVHALAERWQTRARVRTERLLAELKNEQERTASNPGRSDI